VLGENLARITERFGSIEGFVLARAGVSSDVLQRLRHLLLE
jgi:hypothetical protein